MPSHQRFGFVCLSRGYGVVIDPVRVWELMTWCSGRVKGRASRWRRMVRLVEEFPVEMPIITVAGTSGKGTTCALLEATLQNAGHVTGVYSKPHLLAFRERISINGSPITNEVLDAALAETGADMRAFVDRHGPEFIPALYEVLLFTAARVFRQAGVTVMIVEASIGGSNDSSSLLPAQLSILTSVGLDHEIDLGPSIEDISWDKAGIAPRGGLLIVGAGIEESLRKVIQDRCRLRGVRAVVAEPGDVIHETLHGQTVNLHGQEITMPFVGRHQAWNLATVAVAARELGQPPQAIMGVAGAKLPGRFEVHLGTPNWVFDVAHNPLALEGVIRNARRYFRTEEITVLLGATEPHDASGFVNLLSDWGVRLAFCEGFTRAIPTARHRAAAGGYPCAGEFSSPEEAVWELCQRSGTILVTGSLFLVGQCRYWLLGENA
jgi:dihydrofolate synthase / folylpolyglutamate synthase